MRWKSHGQDGSQVGKVRSLFESQGRVHWVRVEEGQDGSGVKDSVQVVQAAWLVLTRVGSDQWLRWLMDGAALWQSDVHDGVW
jgi:hypothetical protein